ncbi:hypothetical protein VTK56DRAFT_510 [Thermocarpiscus australiensis]
MDVLLSIPVLSYLFSTSFTSWSTSLNLLFFYMTWSTLVLSHSPLKIEILGTTALRVALWLVPSLFFLAFDALLPSLAQHLKHNGASALPPRDAASLGRLACLALFNLALETALQAGISLGLSTVLKRPVFRTSTTLPLPWQMIKHLALLFTAREILTYYIHRHLLHGQPAPYLSVSKSRAIPTPKLTKTKPGGRIADLHAQHAHARRAPPFSLLLKADHPIPFLLHRFVPLYLPALALSRHHGNLHLLTFLVFVALTALEETLATSGYAVVPGIVMGGVARRTALHHAHPRAGGNFGSWGVLDWAHGTSLGGDVMADLQAEAGKHQGDVGGAVQEGVDGLRRAGKGRSGRRRSKGDGSE